jgi:hypothetical protein
MNNISIISHTHYLHYCTQRVEILMWNGALTHYLTWIPTLLVGATAPKSGDSQQTNKCESPSLKKPIVQVQKYFDVALSTCALNCTLAQLPGVGPFRVGWEIETWIGTV